MDCGGKRSALPLSPARKVIVIPKTFVCPKALSPLRSASAVHDAQFPILLIAQILQEPG
ncbi:MAG: hypothetical protein ABUL66_02605 [Verrucomicrobiota bacterium]